MAARVWTFGLGGGVCLGGFVGLNYQETSQKREKKNKIRGISGVHRFDFARATPRYRYRKSHSHGISPEALELNRSIDIDRLQDFSNIPNCLRNCVFFEVFAVN